MTLGNTRPNAKQSKAKRPARTPYTKTRAGNFSNGFTEYLMGYDSQPTRWSWRGCKRHVRNLKTFDERYQLRLSLVGCDERHWLRLSVGRLEPKEGQLVDLLIEPFCEEHRASTLLLQTTELVEALQYPTEALVCSKASGACRGFIIPYRQGRSL